MLVPKLPLEKIKKVSFLQAKQVKLENRVSTKKKIRNHIFVFFAVVLMKTYLKNIGSNVEIVKSGLMQLVLITQEEDIIFAIYDKIKIKVMTDLK